MSSLSIIALYNQDLQDDASFLAGFVARSELAAFLLQRLRQTPPNAMAEHQLIVGQRGMGKTSLLRRVAIGLAQDPALGDRFIPLRFREEQYNVVSLDRFWRNCAESLAEWCEDHSPRSQFPGLFDRMSDSDDWRDAQAVAEAFLAETKARSARAVLLVDNLDLILDALSSSENWALRRTLQAPGGPILYGATTHLPDQTANRDAAFYEFFRVHLLAPLSADELISCLRRLAHARGPSGERVLKILAAEPERLRALHDFTGGNPRVLALTYRLLESENTNDAFADLEALLDQVTPFYKGRIEEYLTKQQRAVIDAIALNWNPITSHDLAAATAIEVTTISSQITRLRNDGLIEEVELAGARAGYQMAERFFNIWYLMRHGTRRTRNRVSWLTKFLVWFYPAEDLRRMADEKKRTSGQTSSPNYYREALDGAVEFLSSGGGTLANAAAQLEVASLARAASASPATAGGGQSANTPVQRLAESDRIIAELQACGQADGSARLARALVNKGFALRRLGRDQEAITAYAEVVDRFGAASEPALREQVARALINKGGALRGLERGEEAIAAFDEVVDRFGAASEPALREVIARALINKGAALRGLERGEEAIATYDRVVDRFGAASEPALREQVAWALINKGVALRGLERGEEAIAAYDKLVDRFSAASEPALRELVAWALVNKGVALVGLERGEEAIAACDEVVDRFGVASEPALREQVARAIVYKGFVLRGLGRGEEAIAGFDEVVDRFGAASEPALREQVARALINKGVALRGLGRGEEAIAGFDEVAGRFGASSEPALREHVAWALISKGAALDRLGRGEEAIAAFDEVVDRFGKAVEASLRERVADALVNKGNLLADQLGRLVEAETAYRAAIDASPTAALIATGNIAWILVATDRSAEALSFRHALADLPAAGLALFDSALELIADNFGAAAAHLDRALAAGLTSDTWDFLDDLQRFLRLADARGYGEKLIGHFEAAGHAERLAPVYAALVAFVRGERHLLNFSPEVRGPASKIYRSLVAPLRRQDGETPAPTGSRRGRPPKRRARKA